MKNVGVISLLGLVFLTFSGKSQGQIAISDAHPQYWQYNGKPTLLLGGSVDDNLFQLTGISLEDHLDLLKSIGGNYLRNTLSSRDEGNLWPFFLDESNNLYDLDRWNNDYWLRLEKFLELTSKRDIVVQLEVWATFDFYRENWDRNPFNPKNNTNYDSARVKLPERINTHPVYTDNPFFWSIPEQMNNIRLLWFQQKFVDKILSYTLNFGNVIYCIDNETSVTASWGRFWANYIKMKAVEQKKECLCD